MLCSKVTIEKIIVEEQQVKMQLNPIQDYTIKHEDKAYTIFIEVDKENNEVILVKTVTAKLDKWFVVNKSLMPLEVIYHLLDSKKPFEIGVEKNGEDIDIKRWELSS